MENQERLFAPTEISNIRDLKSFPIHYLQSGIYFLVHKAKVVYIGQAICVVTRIGQHYIEGEKIFDSVWFVPIPKSDLNFIERAFIKLLKPKYNFSGIPGKRKFGKSITTKDNSIVWFHEELKRVINHLLV